ncbi:UPF0721 transmembrane protein [Rhizocola hellebori]|uniref:Probable membrane transporter protein n=1 Tax=Rhizocola hellebori TaxID=1392758 RepID=A0A8J3QA73_9ACTN|nr:sulfite exporter TauE/SafE family protein [Rhizocola hellebori]GIH06167.1 UPF0721 transmembrane protein [Rhizocola hellebori]
MSTYLIASGIICVAAFAQSISGFGFALVAVPLLAVTLDPQTAVVTASMISLAMTLVTATGERKHIQWPPTRDLTISAIFGMPFGLVALKLLPSSFLTGVIAVVTLACTALVWKRWRMSPTPGKVLLAGAASGVLLTATATNGPPLVAVLQAMGLNPRQFRATISAVFALGGLVGAVGFALTGELDAHAATYIGIGLVAAALGGWAGNHAFGRIDATQFRRILLAALVVSSTIALLHALAPST